MAHAVADAAEPPAEHAPEKDMTMTAASRYQCIRVVRTAADLAPYPEQSGE
jgi:hypothetical protein